MQDSKNLFKDPFNPTKEELQIWAFGDYSAPEQDFQLYVTDNPQFALNLAMDITCPSKDFFLGSLYIWAAEQIIHKTNSHTVEQILLSAEKSKDQRLQKFAERTRQLMIDPRSYTYANWGLGGEYVTHV